MRIHLAGLGAATLVALAMSTYVGPAVADGAAPPPRRTVAAKLKPRIVERTVYVYRKNGWCAVNTARLNAFEREVRDIGRVSQDEMRIALSLKADLSEFCGGVRQARSHFDHYR